MNDFGIIRLTSAAKAGIENSVIAAVSRCATQKRASCKPATQKQAHRVFLQPVNLVLIFALLSAASSFAQTCTTGDDMDPATKSALITTAKNYFDIAARGESGSLRQNAIPSLAGDFSGVEAAVNDHKADFSGAQAMPRPPFLLVADGPAPAERAEFLCGVFGPNGQTANSAEFVIPSLPPGQYGIVILDVPTSKQPYTVSYVLQKEGASWKLGGYFVKDTQTNGHDGNWFATQARAFKAKGQNHNAYLYYLQARELLSPVPFMSTQRTDKLYDESQAVKPADIPAEGSSVNLAAGSKSYKLIAVYPLLVGKDLDLVVKYDSPDVSNTTKSFQDNMEVMKALVAKFPEFRDGFAGVVARGVEPSGKDYGTLMSMKEIK
jgi:hypothetical protein